MARRTNITHHATPADLEAGAVVGGGTAIAQFQDEALVLSLGADAVFNFLNKDDVPAAADQKYVINDSTNPAGKWLRAAVSNILGTNLTLSIPQLADGTEELITLAVTGAVPGEAHDLAIFAGGLAGLTYVLQPCTTSGTLSVLVSNNSGATVTSSSPLINIYRLK